MTADDIIKILKLAADAGLITEPIRTAAPVADPKESYATVSVLDEPTEEEMLYWSTPYYDVLMAEKEAKQKALNEEREVRSD